MIKSNFTVASKNKGAKNKIEKLETSVELEGLEDDSDAVLDEVDQKHMDEGVSLDELELKLLKKKLTLLMDKKE